MCVIVFIIKLALSTGALVFAELSTVVPKSGGIYTFLMAAFKDSHSFFGPLLGYNFIFIQMFMVIPASLAIAAQLFSVYVYETVQKSLSCEFNNRYEQLIQNILGIAALCE